MRRQHILDRLLGEDITACAGLPDDLCDGEGKWDCGGEGGTGCIQGLKSRADLEHSLLLTRLVCRDFHAYDGGDARADRVC